MSSSCFFDGNRVEYTRLTKPSVKREAKVTFVPAGAAPPEHLRPKARLRRAQRRGNLLHLSFSSDGGHKRERWTRVSRLLKRQVNVLEGSGLKPGVGNYSEDEDAAIKRRRTGGEAWGSIARSLGRGVNAVTNRGQRLMSPKLAPRGQGHSRVPQDRSINWVDEVTSAMQRLPNQQGTAHDVIAVLKEMGHVLDESLLPGSSKTRVFGLVGNVLSRSRTPQFATLQRPARLGQSGTVVQVTHGRKGHKASVQFQDGAVEAFSVGSLALAASPAARHIAAGASVTVTKEEGGVVKVEAGPRNRPCTVYKYRPELTPVKAVKSPGTRKWLNAKERKKGLDGVAQKNG